jgi:hypothetical protein
MSYFFQSISGNTVSVEGQANRFDERYLFFKRKKNTHPDWVLVTIEKVSVRTDELPNFAGGGELLVIFNPCDSQNSVKEASENFGSISTFALLIEIYVPWEFHKFLPSRFSETPERGGGSP